MSNGSKHLPFLAYPPPHQQQPCRQALPPNPPIKPPPSFFARFHPPPPLMKSLHVSIPSYPMSRYHHNDHTKQQQQQQQQAVQSMLAAARCGQVDECRRLIKAGKDVNERNSVRKIANLNSTAQ
jgi:hypothetical protein